MGKYSITGGRRLTGSVRVQGSKNGVLPLLSASLLIRGETVLTGVPRLADVENALEILRYLGCAAERSGDTVRVDARSVTRSDIPAELMGRMRSSLFFVGPILARCGEVRFSHPGGCALGERPIDLHLAALRRLGAVERDEESLHIGEKGLKGAFISLSFPSVGATENAMLAAVAAEGETVIENAAREPEIAELAEFLRAAGVPVTGEGTSVLYVGGKERLVEHIAHRVWPDRVAAATLLAAGAATGGDVTLENVPTAAMEATLEALRRTGCTLKTKNNTLRLTAPERLTAPGCIVTSPWPGFPTDAQPLLAAAVLRAKGETEIVETVFENRLRYTRGLMALGGDLQVTGTRAVIRGVERLRGTTLQAEDLRGGAALVIAALQAEGESLVEGARHIERGYEDFPAVLRELGAGIEMK